MRAWLRRCRRQSEEEFIAEVDAHLAHETDEQIGRGVPAEEARYAALRQFGNVTRHLERFREASPWFWLETLWYDVRYGWRSLRRSPSLLVAAVASLAVGIGGTTAIFSVLLATVIDPLPYPESERLVFLVTQDSGPPITANIKARDLPEYGRLHDVFEGAAGLNLAQSVVNGADNPTITSHISCNFFEVLGVRTALGRLPLEADCRSSTPQVVVLSHELWTRAFASSPSVLGTAVQLKHFQGVKSSGEATGLTVIGVMPPRVSIWGEQAWIPAKVEIEREDYTFNVLARLRRDVTVPQATARAATLSAHIVPPAVGGACLLCAGAGNGDHPSRFGLDPLLNQLVRDYGSTIYALMAGVGCVLLLACVNVTILQFARTTTRQGEFGLRVSLGAGRRRLLQQAVTESVVLATCGGVAGVALAAAAMTPIARVIVGVGVAPQADIRLNAPAVGLAMLLVLFAAALFGLAPALYAMRLDPARILAGGSRLTDAPVLGRWRALLVAAQITLAFAVCCTTLTLVRSFSALHAAAAPYGSDHVLMVVPREAALEGDRYQRSDARARLWQTLDEALEAVPGVLSVASTAPMALNRFAGTVVQPVSVTEPARWLSQLRCASPDFFSAMRIRVLRGRTFENGGETGHRVAVVSRSFTRAYLGDTNPLGRQVRVLDAPPFCPAGSEPLEIVGVVEDTQMPDPDSGSADSPPTLYVPTSIAPPRMVQLVLRTSVPAAAVRRDVRRAIASVDPELVGRARTLEEDIEEGWMPWPRLLVRAAVSFAGAALLLLIVGVFGVLSYSFAHLRREIGIRMAIGASPRLIARQVIGRSLRWTFLGLAGGIAATMAGGVVASNRVWGMAMPDALTISSVTGLVLAVTLVASWFPAHRAMRVDPVVVLRAE